MYFKSIIQIWKLNLIGYRSIFYTLNYIRQHSIFCSVVFNRLSGEQAALQQFSYILANLLGLALAMYKCHTMGLLPTSQSDWVEFMDQQQVCIDTRIRVSTYLYTTTAYI